MIYEISFIVTIPLYLPALYMLYTIFFEENTTNKLIEISSYIGYGVLLGIIFHFTRVPIVFLIFNVASIFILSFCYEASLLRRLMCTLLIYSIFFIIEITISGIWGFFEIATFEDSTFQSVTGIVAIRLVTVVVTYCLYRLVKRRGTKVVIPSYYYFTQVLILIGTLYLFVDAISNRRISQWELLGSSVVVILVNILILFLDEKVYQAMCVFTEKNILQLQNAAYEEQMTIMNKSLEDIRAIKHDMKNHLITLKGLYKNKEEEEIQKYTSHILEQIQDRQVVTSNLVVDSLIHFKVQGLYKEHVCVKMDLQIPSDIPISAYDLTVILGNLLDNSVDALKEMPYEEEKLFSLRMDYEKGNLIILIDNSFVGKRTTARGDYVTTKAKKEGHGIGLINIGNTIKKYGGQMKVSHTENIFSVAVLLPCENA